MRHLPIWSVGMASLELLKAQQRLEQIRNEQGIKPPAPSTKPDPSWIAELARITPSEPKLPTKLNIDPTLAGGFLRDNLAAVGREYYLFRNHDRVFQDGSGIVTFETARELTKDIHTWRRALQILKQGQGITWDTTGGHIRLFSPAKVCIALKLGYLRGNTVIVDTVDFSGGLQQVKATFYGCIFSTRKLKENQKPAPIKQSTLCEMTGVKPRTQRTYNKIVDVATHANIHILGDEWANIEARQDAAVKHGHIFPIYDRQQKKCMIGKPLPNSYLSKLVTAKYGRRKKANRIIRDDLVQNEGPGNVKEKRIAIFHADKGGALTALNKDPRNDHFWSVGSVLQPNLNRDCRLSGANTWYAVGV